MKIRLSVSARLSIEIEGEDIKDLFKQLAVADEIFSAESECGLCQSPRLMFRVRHVDGFDHYELHCLECRARFVFGQIRKGGLFPKRVDDKTKERLPNRGWAKMPTQRT